MPAIDEPASSPSGRPTLVVKAGILAALAVAAGVTLWMKPAAREPGDGPAGIPAVAPGPAGAGLPRILDVGSTTCLACKRMAVVLDSLRRGYSGRLDVAFVDTEVDEEAVTRYGIDLIPTQIFYDPLGKEIFRHQGFFSEEDILAKWRELGFALDAVPAEPGPVR